MDLGADQVRARRGDSGSNRSVPAGRGQQHARCPAARWAGCPAGRRRSGTASRPAGRSTTPATVTVAGGSPARPMVIVSPGRRAGWPRSAGPAAPRCRRRPGCAARPGKPCGSRRAARAPRAAPVVWVRRAAWWRSARRSWPNPTGSAVTVPGAARTASRTAAGSAPGWTWTCQSTRDVADRARGHGGLRGGEERPEAREQRHRDRDPGRRPRPAGPARRRSRPGQPEPDQPLTIAIPRGVRRAARRRIAHVRAAARRSPGRGWRRPAPRPARRRPAAARRPPGRAVSWSSCPVGSSARISAGPAGQHPRDRDPLGLPAGQLLGQLRGQRRRCRAGPAPRRARSTAPRLRRPGEQQRQRDVLGDVQRGDQARALEDDPDRPGPARGAAARVPASDTVPAGRRRPARPADAAGWTCPSPTAR